MALTVHQECHKVMMMLKPDKLVWVGAIENSGSKMALMLAAREVGVLVRWW